MHQTVHWSRLGGDTVENEKDNGKGGMEGDLLPITLEKELKGETERRPQTHLGEF